MKKSLVLLSTITLIVTTHATEKLGLEKEEKIQKNVSSIKIISDEILTKKNITQENLAHLKNTVLALKELWGNGCVKMVSNYINHPGWSVSIGEREEGRGTSEVQLLYRKGSDQVKDALKECFPDKK